MSWSSREPWRFDKDGPRRLLPGCAADRDATAPPSARRGRSRPGRPVAYRVFVCRLRGPRTQPVVTLCGEWQRARLELIGDRLAGCLNVLQGSHAARRTPRDTDTACEGEQ
jgi:hypothetical protein